MSGNDATILRSSASPKKVSSRETSANAHVQISPRPMLNFTMGAGGPRQQNRAQPSNVVVYGGNGQTARPPGNVQIMDNNRRGPAQPQMVVRTTPQISNGGLLLCQQLVLKYIEEQSAEGGDLAAAELAKGHLAEIEMALTPATAGRPMVQAQVGSSGGARPAQAPRRGVRVQSGEPLPMVSVDNRNGRQVTLTNQASIPVPAHLVNNGMPVVDVGDDPDQG